MAFLDWSDRFIIGIPIVDRQHKRLFAMVNELYDGLQSGHGPEHIRQVLVFLVDYTKEHFRTEEQLMLQANYAEFAAHRREHDDLAAVVTKLVKDGAHESHRGAIDLAALLGKWLIHHVTGSDLKYVSALRAAGLAEPRPG